MNIKVIIIENLRQIQIDMIRRSYHSYKSHSTFRGQGRILGLLREEGQITRSDLGEKLQMSRAALAELLGKMEKSGLIIRTQSPTDKRRIVICLTEAGKDAAQAIDIDHSSLPEMLDCLDGHELNEFNSYLERIIAGSKSSEKFPKDMPDEYETREIIENVVESICKTCPGPESCKHDYLRYGHTRPNPDYCKYADQFPF